MQSIELPENIQNWLKTGERVQSANAIFTKLSGIDLSQDDSKQAIPWDPSDFKRCIDLLEAIPEFKQSFHEMKTVSKQWETLVNHWDELESL
jgi:hypothetical protein